MNADNNENKNRKYKTFRYNSLNNLISTEKYLKSYLKIITYAFVHQTLQAGINNKKKCEAGTFGH